MIEKRLTPRVTGYWDLLRKEQAMPEVSAFNRGQVDDVWPFCMLLQVEPGTDFENRQYYIAEIGPKLVELYGENLTGQRISAKQKQFKAANLIRKAHTILQQPAPLMDEGKFVNDANAVVKYRSCIVPFGNPTTLDVTHLLVAMSWRQF